MKCVIIGRLYTSEIKNVAFSVVAYLVKFEKKDHCISVGNTIIMFPTTDFMSIPTKMLNNCFDHRIMLHI